MGIYRISWVIAALVFLGCATIPAGAPQEDLVRHWNRAGEEAFRKGDTDEAIRAFSKALELDPRDTSARIQRGEAYATRKGDAETAIADFNAAIAADPQNALAYYNRGKAYKQKGDQDRALSDYTKAIELDPGYAQAYINRGVIYGRDRAQYDRAIADFDKAIEIDPAMAEAYFNKALACEKGGRPGDAVSAYGEFIRHASARYEQYIDFARQKILDLQK